MIQKLVSLGLAGALGTLARYGLSGLVNRFNGAYFPLGTVTVNLTGCFLVGLLWALFENRWPVSGETRIIVLVGFMGAFTTFSTLMFETSRLLGSGEWFYAVLNLGLQNGLGLIAMGAGTILGRLV